jgi:CDP-diacylglycerol---glycerol-3-phosphate 3-phosphatidyltransferase
MNLPNKLTMFRIILIPVIIAIYLVRSDAYYWYALMGVVFVIASFTDFLDGYLARKYNLVTTFGKFMDPLADKLLVITALLLFTDNQAAHPSMWMPFYVPLIIIARELIVTSIRLVAVGEGKVIAASNLGKAKTAVTMIAIIFYFFIMPFDFLWFNILGYGLVGLSVILTLVSGIEYFIKNRQAILSSK